MSDLLTPDEAAARLKMSERTLRELRKQGRIRYIQPTPRKIFYDPADCDAFLASCRRLDERPPEPAQPQPARAATRRRKAGIIVPFSQRMAGSK